MSEKVSPIDIDENHMNMLVSYLMPGHSFDSLVEMKKMREKRLHGDSLRIIDMAQFVIDRIIAVPTKWHAFRDNIVKNMLDITKSSTEYDLYCVIEESKKAFYGNSSSRLLRILSDACLSLNIDKNKAFMQHHKQIKSRQHKLALSSNHAGVFEARNPTVSIAVPVGGKSKQVPEQTTHSNNNSSKSNEVALLKPSAPPSEEDLFNVGYSGCEGFEMNTYSPKK